jgi:H+-transporting ATPase
MRSSIMKEAIAQPKASASKPESKDELKTLPMPALEKRLGASPNGLTHAEAAKRPM